MPIDALSVLCAQLTRDLLAIAKFLLSLKTHELYRNKFVYIAMVRPQGVPQITTKNTTQFYLFAR